MISDSPCSGPSRWVDPFLGNAEADLPTPEGIAATWWCAKPPVGNTHPGATLPFGMVSACSYSGAYVTGYGQYDLSLTGDSPELLFDRHELIGIAHFQQSGTGRIRMYYNYLLTMPYVGDDLKTRAQRNALVNERAWPGYYSGRFEEKAVDFEVTTSDRASWHRYEFASEDRGNVAIDISAGGLLVPGMETYPQSASVMLTGKKKACGWVMMEGVTVNFHIKVIGNVKSSALWVGDRILENATDFRLDAKTRAEATPFGLVFEGENPGEPIEVKIGFSLVDLENAKLGLETLSDTFPETAEAAANRWDGIFAKIDAKFQTETEREIFYTAMYHAALKPASFYDQNPFTKEPGPFFFDLSTLWDLYKCQLPLTMTLWPEWGGDFVTFLMEVAHREGGFPVSYLMDNAPERFDKQATGLCHMILADAQNRGIRADWDAVLRTLWRTSQSGQGRGGRFAEFAKNHVVEPLSHTLDLAFANFCVAQMAMRLGDQIIYEEAKPLAHHWVNAFDKETGLLKVDSTYYEGENWNYSFRFIHDMVGRIDLAGGEERFVELLDKFFGFAAGEEDDRLFRFEGLNNEPDMESPYAYLFAGRHDRTAEVVRAVMKYSFTTGKGGLAGNEDSGGLSSWYVWSAVGLFPVTGLPIMLLGSPIVENATLNLPDGPFNIEVENQAADHIFVQRAWLNGIELDRCYLKMSEFCGEAHLRFEMGPEPTGFAKETRPPSFLS